MKIEFDNVKLEIPDSWKDIKLSEYEKWYMLKPETRFEMVTYIAEVCNIDAKLLMQSPTQLFNIISEAIQFVFNQDLEPKNKCEIDGEDYFISFSDKLTLGEYVDIEAVLESESKNKLSELLAILCRPIGEKYNPDLTEERIEIFKNLSCDKALPLISFFLLKKKKSDEILSHCLTVTAQAELFLKDIETTVINGDGIKQFPIWQRIRYIYLTKSLKKELLKFSDFSSIK
nr:MAG TPA: hypothetical protein [Caudoviricetes sp.]